MTLQRTDAADDLAGESPLGVTRRDVLGGAALGLGRRPPASRAPPLRKGS